MITNSDERFGILDAVIKTASLPEGWCILNWISDTGTALHIAVRLPDGEEVLIEDPHFPKDRLPDRVHNLRRAVRAVVMARLHPLP